MSVLLVGEIALRHPVLALVVAVFAAEAVYRALYVVGGYEVHQYIYRGLGVVLEYRHYRVDERARVAAPDVAEDSLAEGVVHHGIELVAEEIAPLHAVALLVGGVLPYLADDELFFAHFLD